MPSYSDPAVTTAAPITQNTGGPSTAAILTLAAGVLSCAMAGYFFWQSKVIEGNITSIQTTITAQQSELALLKPLATEVDTYAGLARNLHSVFDNQKRWESVLGMVEKRLYKRMAVTSVQLTDAGSITFSGRTADYMDYSKIFATLTDVEGSKFFTNVKPLSVKKDGTTASDANGRNTVKTEFISFSFSMNMTPTVLNAAPVSNPTVQNP